jgi:hypothetical protein
MSYLNIQPFRFDPSKSPQRVDFRLLFRTINPSSSTLLGKVAWDRRDQNKEIIKPDSTLFRELIRNALVMILLTFSFFSLAQTSVNAQKVAAIGSNRELFVDSFLIHKMVNVQLVMHTPEDKGPVLYFDKPWEGPSSGYVSILKDSGAFKMYYRGNTPLDDDRVYNATCYAESKDGVNWIKPNLGLFEVKGTRNNNIVLYDNESIEHNFSPFLDTRKGVPPEQRYKGIGGMDIFGLFAYASPDGIHWKKMFKHPILINDRYDSQNVVFWSEAEQLYLCYYRSWTREDHLGIRTISRATSPDFIHWSKGEPMTFGDTPMEHLYTNQTDVYYRAPQIYISTAARLIPKRVAITNEQAKAINVDSTYFKNSPELSDVVLLSSRGGNRYSRTFMTSFIRPGIGYNNWVSRTNYPALHIVETSPTEMSLYVERDYVQPTLHLSRYSLRIDGFASVQASYNWGELVTKPFTFTGSNLFINYSTSAAGSIFVELLDENGNPSPSFSKSGCDEIIGDEIDRKVTWKNNPDLQTLNGKVVRLHFFMKDADLYSFIFK